MLPAAILYLAIAPFPSTSPVSQRATGPVANCVCVLLAGTVCVFKCTPASVKRGLHVIPAALRDPTCSFSQHKCLTNASMWVCPMEPKGMKKPESIQ